MYPQHTIQGRSLLIRLTTKVTQYIPFTPPELKLELYIHNTHNNRALLPLRINRSADNISALADNIILYNAYNNHAIAATPTQFGTDYDPDTWDTNSPYQLPHSYAETTAPLWVALDNIQPFTITLTDYNIVETYHSKPTGGLTSITKRNMDSIFPQVFVQPK